MSSYEPFQPIDQPDDTTSPNSFWRRDASEFWLVVYVSYVFLAKIIQYIASVWVMHMGQASMMQFYNTTHVVFGLIEIGILVAIVFKVKNKIARVVAAVIAVLNLLMLAFYLFSMPNG